MIPPEEALGLILAEVSTLAPESARLSDAVGRVLAQDIVARQDLPPLDNSAMDGYAVRVQDCAGATPGSPVSLRIRETIRAGGRACAELKSGEAVKIMTGAPLPAGADAVIMWEAASAPREGRVGILRAPRPGENVRRSGEDVREDDLILRKGAVIRPYEVALLAAEGVIEAPVYPRPRPAVIATGSELVNPSAPLAPGRVRNSLSPALSAALARWGAVPLDVGIVPDEPELLRAAFERALDRSDALIVSGGVSAGDFDYTRAVLEDLGARIVFWKVAIKPGKPLLFAVCRGKPVFGLPGNPVAALVCLEEFVRPAVEKMRGARGGFPSYHLEGRLENDYFKDPERRQYLFCAVAEDSQGYLLRVIRPQGSAMLGMSSRAGALAVAPQGLGRLIPGMRLKFRWLK